MPSPITAGRCRKSPGGCKSAARPSIGSWKPSDCTVAATTPAPKALQQSDSRGKSPEIGPGRGPPRGTNRNRSRRVSAKLGFGFVRMTRLGTPNTQPERKFAGLKGEFAMPGVRIDRLLASTAAILLLAGAATTASTKPKFGTAAETAPAPGATGAPSGEINRSAKPAEPSSQEP